MWSKSSCPGLLKIRDKNSNDPRVELDSDETKKVRDELRKLGYI